jgi:hypothetical protein
MSRKMTRDANHHITDVTASGFVGRGFNRDINFSSKPGLQPLKYR